MNTPVSVLLVDDHAIVREGYRRLLARQPTISVAGEAGSGAEAYALFVRLRPDIVIMDITLPGASGIEVMRRMLRQHPQTRVLIFSMHDDVIFARRALQAGAKGFISKSSAPNQLVEAVLKIASGEGFVSPAVAQKMALHQAVSDASSIEGLTAREFEVLQALARGKSIKAIASTLGLTPKTVANHQSVIKQKLQAETTFQLLKVAEQLGLSRE